MATVTKVNKFTEIKQLTNADKRGGGDTLTIDQIQSEVDLVNRANVRGSEGAGTTILTTDDKRWQVFNLTAARSVRLPSTGVRAGQKFRIENRGDFLLSIESSDTTVITAANIGSGSPGDPSIHVGYVELIALQDDPTAPGHWKSVEQVSNTIIALAGIGNFTGGVIQVTKSGRNGSVTIRNQLTHASLSTVSAVAGTLPVWARPGSNPQTTAHIATGLIYRMNIQADGNFGITYFNSSLATVAQTIADPSSAGYGIA